MGQNIPNNKCKILLDYYTFQKKIYQYLKDWKDKNDRYKKEIGYIIEPDWIEEWKRISDYDNLKTKYLDPFNITSSKISKEQQILINQHLLPEIKDYEENLIFCTNSNNFLVYDTFFSLEYLQNFCNETTYKLFQTNGRVENVEYIFKRKMLIILFNAKNIIKIILFNEKNNKIINMKYIFNDNVKYKQVVKFYVTNNSDTIIKKLMSKEVFNKNNKEFVYKKNNEVIYSLFYEEEKNNLNNTNSTYGNTINNNINNNNNININNSNNNYINNINNNKTNVNNSNNIINNNNNFNDTISNNTNINNSNINNNIFK